MSIIKWQSTEKRKKLAILNKRKRLDKEEI